MLTRQARYRAPHSFVSCGIVVSVTLCVRCGVVLLVQDGWTPLHRAVCVANKYRVENKRATITALIDGGADVDTRDKVCNARSCSG